jgi:hypothetical protein
MFIIIPIGEHRNSYIKTQDDFLTISNPKIYLDQPEALNTDGFYHRYYQFRPLWIPVFPLKQCNSGYLVVGSKQIFVGKYVLKTLIKNKLTVSDVSKFATESKNQNFQNSLGGGWYALLEKLLYAINVTILFCWILFGFLFTVIKLFTSKWQMADIQLFFDLRQYLIPIFISFVMLLACSPLFLLYIIWTMRINKRIQLFKKNMSLEITSNQNSVITKPKKTNDDIFEFLTNLDKLNSVFQESPTWCWWTSKFPIAFALELNNTMMYFGNEDRTQPPSSKISIQFINPKSVSFLHNNGISENGEKLYDLLNQDKLDPQLIVSDEIGFNDLDIMNKAIENNKQIDVIFGEYPTDPELAKSMVQFAMNTTIGGVIVFAESIKLVNYKGEFQLSDVEKYHADWWKYYNEYWDSKNTETPFPIDYMPETMFPLQII